MHVTRGLEYVKRDMRQVFFFFFPPLEQKQRKMFPVQQSKKHAVHCAVHYITTCCALNASKDAVPVHILIQQRLKMQKCLHLLGHLH